MNEKKEYKNLAVQALNRMLGDDVFRARSAFKNMTSEQMKEQHGMSGKTRAEILSGYEDCYKKISNAIDWVQKQCV